MISLLLTAFMIVMLPGIHIAEAETKKLQEGVTYGIGDTIEIESDSWVVHDSQFSAKKNIKAGSYVLKDIDFTPINPSGGYWSARVDLITVGGDTYDVWFYFYNSQPVETDMDKRYIPKGITCFYGDGSEDQPFRFEVLLEKIPTVEVTLEMGEDHEDIAKRIAEKAAEVTYSGGSSLSLTVNVLDSDGDPRTLGELMGDVRDLVDLLRSDGWDGSDDGRFLRTLAFRPVSEYSDWSDIDEELEKASETDLKEDSSYTVHAIWVELISQIDLTVEHPKAGTKISCTDEEYGSDQSPVPVVSVNSGNCHIAKTYSGEELRDVLAYMTRDEKPSFYPGIVMKAGEKYTVYAALEPEFAYLFDREVKLTVNGEDVTSEIVRVWENSLDFFYDIEAVGEDKAYYPDEGDGQTWKAGSSSGAKFIFKSTSEDDQTYDNFLGIKVDGKDVERTDGNYTAAPGSLVIELQPAFLKTLSAGEHTLTALFKDGLSASAKFTVAEKGNVPSDDAKPAYIPPKTGIE